MRQRWKWLLTSVVIEEGVRGESKAIKIRWECVCVLGERGRGNGLDAERVTPKGDAPKGQMGRTDDALARLTGAVGTNRIHKS